MAGSFKWNNNRGGMFSWFSKVLLVVAVVVVAIGADIVDTEGRTMAAAGGALSRETRLGGGCLGASVVFSKLVNAALSCKRHNECIRVNI